MSVIFYPPVVSSSGASSTPLVVPANTTFTIPKDGQVLFDTTIDSEGVIDASDGLLVQVD